MLQSTKKSFEFLFMKTELILVVWIGIKEKHTTVVSQCSGAGVSRHRLSTTPREITTRNKATNRFVAVLREKYSK